MENLSYFIYLVQDGALKFSLGNRIAGVVAKGTGNTVASLSFNSNKQLEVYYENRGSGGSVYPPSDYLAFRTYSPTNQIYVKHNNVGKFDYPVTKEGYTPIGIVGVKATSIKTQSGATTYDDCIKIQSFYLYSAEDGADMANITIANTGRDAHLYLTYNVTVLYVKKLN